MTEEVTINTSVETAVVPVLVEVTPTVLILVMGVRHSDIGAEERATCAGMAGAVIHESIARLLSWKVT